MTKHLQRKNTHGIAKQLDEDIYDGNLDHWQVHRRLMQTIVECVNNVLWDGYRAPISVEEHEHQPALSVSLVATVLLNVWENKDYQYMETLCHWACNNPLTIDTVVRLPSDDVRE